MVDSNGFMHLPDSLLQTLPELPEDLFPLPLSAFEKYLIWDETPQQPMSSFIELHFLDPLQVSVMEEAIAAAVRIHPMLSSTIQDLHGNLVWTHRPEFKHRLVAETERLPLVGDRPVPIDLFKEPGIRFWYSQSNDGHSRVLIQLHHAAADGVGVRRFLIDAMTFYSCATAPDQVNSSQRPPWNKVDLGVLKRRADFSDSFGGPPSKPLTIWQRIKNARFFHFQLPRPLLRSTPPQIEERDSNESGELRKTQQEPLEHLLIDRETSEAILEKARIMEVGINELSLAFLFESCSLWNQRNGDANPNSRLRLLMPYDLRSRVDLRMSATNRLSFSFLGRTQADCNDLTALIRSIGAEVQAMKDSHLPLDFLGALEGASKNPRVMRWAMKRSRNMATAVLTYAGDISRGMQKYFPEKDGVRIVGDARLDKILAAPPTRDNTHISMALCINWGQLCISAAWNREGLSRRQCQEFLSLYRSRWLKWLQEPGTNS